MAYDPQRRSLRGHRRVVRTGVERSDVDDADVTGTGLTDVDSQYASLADFDRADSSDLRAPGAKNAEDDRRILTELPPHWAVFNERE